MWGGVMSVTIQCVDHPEYKARQTPKDCPGCWTLWLAARDSNVERVRMLSDLDDGEDR